MDDLAHSGTLYPKIEFECNIVSGVDENTVASFHFYFAHF